MWISSVRTPQEEDMLAVQTKRRRRIDSIFCMVQFFCLLTLVLNSKSLYMIQFGGMNWSLNACRNSSANWIISLLLNKYEKKFILFTGDQAALIKSLGTLYHRERSSVAIYEGVL